MKAVLLTATAALLLSAGTAQADLVPGDTMNAQITHTGPAGGLGFVSDTHTYGGTDTFSTSFFGSVDVTSPDPLMAGDNSLVLDFTNYASNYAGYANEEGTLTLTGLIDDVLPGSGDVLIGGVSLGSVFEIGNTLVATWTANDVLSLPGTHELTVVWASVPVPAPGAAALLGLAGVMTRRRRRQH